MKALFLLFCLIGCIAACNARGPSNILSFNENNELVIATAGNELDQGIVAQITFATNNQQEVTVLPQKRAEAEVTGEMELKMVSEIPPNITSIFSYNAKGLNGLEYSGRNSLTTIQGGVQIKECGCVISISSISTGEILTYDTLGQKMMMNTNKFTRPIDLLANLETNETVLMQAKFIAQIAEITGIMINGV